MKKCFVLVMMCGMVIFTSCSKGKTVEETMSLTDTIAMPEEFVEEAKENFQFESEMLIAENNVSAGDIIEEVVVKTTKMFATKNIEVYSSANTESEVLETVHVADEVEIIADGEWAVLALEDGRIGYVEYSSLSETCPEELNVTMYAKKACNVRSSNTTESEIIDTLSFAESVTVAYKDTWNMVVLEDGTRGFVSAELLVDEELKVEEKNKNSSTEGKHIVEILTGYSGDYTVCGPGGRIVYTREEVNSWPIIPEDPIAVQYGIPTHYHVNLNEKVIDIWYEEEDLEWNMYWFADERRIALIDVDALMNIDCEDWPEEAQRWGAHMLLRNRTDLEIVRKYDEYFTAKYANYTPY